MASPLLAAVLVAVPPVHSAFAVQQVHVAAGKLLLTANHSAVEPLATPLYVTQEMLHRHILGGARAHGTVERANQWAERGGCTGGTTSVT